METRSASRLLIRIKRKLAHATAAQLDATTDKARARHARRVRELDKAERQLARDVARSSALWEA